MSFSDILFPRNEILKGDGIQGIIDIENLNNKKKKTLESSPSAFFDLTFPTTDIKKVVENLHDRYNSPNLTPGLFLLEGLKGSGKSHLELLIYHLLQNNIEAQDWLIKNNIKCELPKDATVLIHKFTDFPIEALWDLIFEKVGYKGYQSSNLPPNLNQIRDSLQGRKLVLILDELELGFASIADKSKQAQNLAFLQMLSEEAQRSDDASITIFASIYNSNNEPGATLKRVPRIDIKFSEPQDRKMVILHRLFSNYLKHDRKKVQNTVQSYVNQWKRIDLRLDEKYVDRFIESYPFTPELMDIILNRVLNRNFQGNRGPLGLLGRVIKNNYQKADVISTSHLNITEAAIRNYLADLDPGQTFIQCALNDLRDLEQTPLANEIVSSTLLATITSTGNIKGIKEQELARQVIKPGDNFNDFTTALNAFVQFGAYFQHSEDSYFFDTQEKPYAKVEYKSLNIDHRNALNFALDRYRKNVFNDTYAIVYREESQVKNDLFQMDKNSLRYILSPKRLIDDERKKIYSGIENPNNVLLLEPKSEKFNALNNQDIIRWGQLNLAAFDLKNSTTDPERKRQYEKIENDNARYIDDIFRKAGLTFVLVTKTSDGLEFELENVGTAISRTEIFEQLKKNIFPVLRIEEHLIKGVEKAEGKSNWIMNQTVLDVKMTYRKTLGFPVILTHTFLIDAIKNLCQSKLIGLRHNRESFCGRYPTYSDSEWNEAYIVEPFPDEENKSTFKKPEKNHKPEFIESETGKAESTIDNIEPINISTTNVNSLIALRQEIAARLGVFENASVTRVRFTIFLEQANADLGTFPSAFRGQLSGISDIHFELTFTNSGNFSKSQLEQMTEQLPVFPGSYYKAELKGVNKNIGESLNV